MSGGIYTIRFLGVKKFYVGKAKSFKNRRLHHLWLLNRDRHHNTHLQAVFNAVGADAFKFCVEEEICDSAIRSQREQFWLDQHFPLGVLFNFADSSLPVFEGKKSGNRVAWNNGLPSPRKGIPRSAEHRLAISLATTGKRRTDETRRRISESKTGKSTVGRSPSLETRAAISAALLGRKRGPRSEDVKAKIAAGHRGKKASPETRAKMSAAAKARCARQSAEAA